ncbi:hypothetical protein DIRU0_C28722 [Diutina rugosa]
MVCSYILNHLSQMLIIVLRGGAMWHGEWSPTGCTVRRVSGSVFGFFHPAHNFSATPNVSDMEKVSPAIGPSQPLVVPKQPEAVWLVYEVTGNSG